MLAGFLAAAMAAQTIGGIFSARQEAKGLNQEADDLLFQANEMRERNKLNNQQIDIATQEITGAQEVATAYGGAAVDSGSPLLNYAKTAHKASIAKSNALREVNFVTGQMEASASNKRRYAKNVKLASYFGAAAGVSKGLYDVKESQDIRDSRV